MLACGRWRWRKIVIFSILVISFLFILPLYFGLLDVSGQDIQVYKNNNPHADIVPITIAIPEIGRRFNPKLLAGRPVSQSNKTQGNSSLQQQTLDLDGRKAEEKEGEKFQNEVNYNVHAFYYSWYGNPGQDGKYFHWNHEYLPHWEKRISDKYPTGQAHVPPDDIGSSFYPVLGPYSSLDESVTRAHMMQMQQAGIGVLALSWYPPGMADDHGQPVEFYITTIFDIADQYNIKVCFHIEPYKSRSPESVSDNLKYILEKYGDHPAFYRHSISANSDKLPLVYIYDSYLIPAGQWTRLLKKRGDISIRGSIIDALVIGLLVEKKHIWELASGGFDGVYTYFAAEKFSYGSTKRNWKEIAASAKQNNMIFIPSVGPGYDDTKVRPWNSINSRVRNNGAYYDAGWRKATTLPGVEMVSITSFNEWHEGTQIEPASHESKHGEFSYLTYEPYDPEHYLKMTKKWSMKMLNRSRDLT